MKKQICLINPPSAFLLDERVFMSLGILKIAAVLEERGYDVHMLDTSGIDNYLEVVRDYLNQSKTDLFGFTATTPQMPYVRRIAQTIRELRPSAKTILGGSHVTLVHAAYRREQAEQTVKRAKTAFDQLAGGFDVLVAGDGEKAIFEALLPNAPKVVDGDNPRGNLFLSNSDLDTLPFPARHLLDVDSYRYWIEGIRSLSLITQLGCPFACGFCGGRDAPSLRRPRVHSIDKIIEEMEVIYKDYGIHGIMFYDDELNVNPNMIQLMKAISALKTKLGVEFRLRGFIKSELFNDEQAKAMYDAGFRWILTGFESGSPRILKNINKKSTLEDNTRCVEIARRHGLKVKALMSLGHPGESEETVLQTRDWLLQVKPEDFDLTIITTYPGTPYYDKAVRSPENPDVWIYTFEPTGDRLYSYEVDYGEVSSYYKGCPDEGYQAFVYTDTLRSEDLVAMRDKVEKEVREQLKIPYNPRATKNRYEHSMGQMGALPSSILRTTPASLSGSLSQKPDPKPAKLTNAVHSPTLNLKNLQH